MRRAGTDASSGCTGYGGVKVRVSSGIGMKAGKVKR